MVENYCNYRNFFFSQHVETILVFLQTFFRNKIFFDDVTFSFKRMVGSWS